MCEKDFIDRLKNIKCVAFDLDGTVYLGDTVINGVKETLHTIRDSGRQIVFLTNNSSRTDEFYYNKLEKMGLCNRVIDGVITSGDVTCRYLAENRTGESVQLLGTELLKNDFIKNEITIVDNEGEICVLAFDTELTYKKLTAFCKSVEKGAYYVATHPDNVCPSDSGNMPDAGSFIALIEKATGRVPDLVIGKPHNYLGQYLMAKYDLKKEEVLMVGDRLYTDIRFANNCDFLSLLVLSGETDKEASEKSSDKSDFVLPSVYELNNYLK